VVIEDESGPEAVVPVVKPKRPTLKQLEAAFDEADAALRASVNAVTDRMMMEEPPTAAECRELIGQVANLNAARRSAMTAMVDEDLRLAEG
jgi:hypothetical protein